ncbi:hypothetical protein RJ639_000389 [Escallonia herrerae]|uniref:MBD domain-containing protein n=1 Tax=Escallonia herrerae TaxID=1293975 RepID=A0AA88X7N0_9ASTE|nr:hypothetical protein RJ639_000389 [Escallonia herrerae]
MFQVLPTQEQFEDIRSKFTQDPFFCNKKPNFSCEDPADIEYDSSRIWLADKPNIPKTPAGFQRGLYLRKDFSKLDTHYITPAGNKVRSAPGIESFLEENPEYGLSTSDFSFAPPKIMEDTIPEHIDRKGSGSGSKKMKTRKKDEAREILEGKFP